MVACITLQSVQKQTCCVLSFSTVSKPVSRDKHLAMKFHFFNWQSLDFLIIWATFINLWTQLEIIEEIRVCSVLLKDGIFSEALNSWFFQEISFTVACGKEFLSNIEGAVSLTSLSTSTDCHSFQVYECLPRSLWTLSFFCRGDRNILYEKRKKTETEAQLLPIWWHWISHRGQTCP